MKLLDGVPYVLLVVAAVLMAIVPFGQSHLLEKTRMLMSGTLRRPIDWFDLALHSAPLLLLIAKLAADFTRRLGR